MCVGAGAGVLIDCQNKNSYLFSCLFLIFFTRHALDGDAARQYNHKETQKYHV